MRDAPHVGSRAVGHGIEIDPPLVGLLHVSPSRVPRVELHRRHLHRPDHVGELGDAQLVRVQSVAREVDAHGLEPRRRPGRDALLVHLLAADAGREAVQHARPLPQRVDDPRPDGEVVVGRDRASSRQWRGSRPDRGWRSAPSAHPPGAQLRAPWSPSDRTCTIVRHTPHPVTADEARLRTRVRVGAPVSDHS